MNIFSAYCFLLLLTLHCEQVGVCVYVCAFYCVCAYPSIRGLKHSPLVLLNTARWWIMGCVSDEYVVLGCLSLSAVGWLNAASLPAVGPAWVPDTVWACCLPDTSKNSHTSGLAQHDAWRKQEYHTELKNNTPFSIFYSCDCIHKHTQKQRDTYDCTFRCHTR